LRGPGIRALAAAVLAAVWLPCGAAPPDAGDAAYRLKPGARGKACLACHAEIAEALAQASVHSPVRAGRCTDCHDAHATSHGKLLAAAPEEICGTCHADVAPPSARSVHDVALAGQCSACHDPHASPNPSMLVEAGNVLCLGCHADLAQALEAAEFKHSPVERSCLGCHDPHASADVEFLLKKDERTLCGSCHQPDRDFFVKAHRGYPVGKSRCTSCHDPHGSSSRASLWATVHPPVASGLCEQCHEPATSADPLAVKATGVDACRPCHGEVVGRTLTARHTHWPVVEGRGCLNCHGPHATPVDGLLRDAPEELCFGCHAGTGVRQARTETKHPPAEDGQCSACHDAHASDATFLLVGKDVTETCSTCHDWGQHSSHPIGEGVVDPRNPNLIVDCESCHRSHGAAHPHLAPFDTNMELCVQCHASFRR
jgi:predicted CXXCH cytochrome family protein